MNTESKFSMILSSDETIQFCEGVYKPAFLIKRLRTTLLLTLFLGGFFSFFFMGFSAAFNMEMVENPFTWFFNFDNKILKVYLLIVATAFVVSCFTHILASSNTYFCVTNKRFIIRSGGFSTNFVDYELKDIFSVEVTSGMFDLQGENASGNINITLRQYESDSEGKLLNKSVGVSSIMNAYKAYKIMDEYDNIKS